MKKKKVVTVFGASRDQHGSKEYIQAENLGKKFAQLGWIVRNGGYSGTMEASAKGVKESKVEGSKSEGCICSGVFTKRTSVGNKYLTEIKDHKSLTARLETLTDKDVDAYVVLPGSIGTLTELCLIWCLIYIKVRKSPVFVFRKPFENIIDAVIQNGVADKPKKEMFTFIDSIDDIFTHLKTLKL